ncbi:MAG: chemotaxis protein CheX [Kiritimatiellae bacterium]|nr:chemotaxis protein CheX [Kiritimatiellia bacterium]
MEDVQEIVRDAVATALERFSFMFSEEPEDEQVDPGAGDLLRTTIVFTGPPTGKLGLAAPVRWCQELAANILGLSPEETKRDSAEDAFRELANVACGELLERLGGEEDLFDIAVPEMVVLTRSEWDELAAQRATVKLAVDDTPLLAWAEIQS